MRKTLPPKIQFVGFLVCPRAVFSLIIRSDRKLPPTASVLNLRLAHKREFLSHKDLL
jgi:hypothetical protein